MEIKDMTLEQLRARASEIRQLADNKETDMEELRKLETEAQQIAERIKELEAEQRRANIQAVAAGQGETVRSFGGQREEERHYDASSPEYRTAFLKNLLDLEMTKEERAAFVATTANTAATLPTTMLNQIWNLVNGSHAIMGDITVYRTGTILEVVKHTSIDQGKAKKVGENAANDDEKNTFVKVTLSGSDFSKHVDISYAQSKMSIDALEKYLTDEIAAGIGEAMAEDVVTTVEGGIAAANKITTAAVGTVTFAELAKLFGALKRVGAVTLYATRATIYGQLVGMVDSTGRPIFQPTAQAGQEGVLLGATIKVEDAVADGKILIGDAKKVVYNMVQDIMIESDKDIKKHVYTYSGYARGQGALVDDKAFAELTVKTS